MRCQGKIQFLVLAAVWGVFGFGAAGVFAAGPTGAVLDFDGVNDYISAADNAVFDQANRLSVSVWIEPDDAPAGDEYIIYRYNNYYLKITADRKIIGSVHTDSARVTSNSAVAADGAAWTHLELTYDKDAGGVDEIKLYINGQLDAVGDYSTAISASTKKVYIGAGDLAGDDTPENYFDGAIGDIKIYDYARTEEEIRLDYNAGLAAHLGPSGKTCSEDPAGCMDFGLVGHWDMDEGGGSVLNDKSGNNNHGTLTNGPKWTKGKNGGALQFDGKDDYVDCGNDESLNITEAITIEAWVRHDEGGVYDGILQKGSFTSSFGKYEIHTTNDNKLRFILNGTTDNSVITSNSIPVGLWTHIVASWDGITIRAYINGVVDQNTDLFSGPLTTDSNPLRIGMYYSSGFIFNGQIDEVRIYNRALTEAEVRYHYNQGKPVAQWDMDEGEGTRAFDASGNNNTGVLINGPAWVEGKHGSALSFDGADDYVNCGADSSLNITNSMTASAWIYPKTLGEGSAGHIISRGGTGGWCFYAYTGNSLKLYAGTIQAVSSANSITLNQWQYATVVYDKQNVRFL